MIYFADIDNWARPKGVTVYDGDDDPVRQMSRQFKEKLEKEIATAGGLDAWRKQEQAKLAQQEQAA
jgi:hypothetical protein